VDKSSAIGNFIAGASTTTTGGLGALSSVSVTELLEIVLNKGVRTSEERAALTLTPGELISKAVVSDVPAGTFEQSESQSGVFHIV